MKRKWRKNKKKIIGSDHEFLIYIPEEIVVNILPNLPVDSLQRFRCVSKQWNLWVSKIKNEKQNLLRCSVSEALNVSFGSIHQTTCIQEMGVPWKDPRVAILGSCNGLVLIRYCHNLYLWNPTTGWLSKVLAYNYEHVVQFSGLVFNSRRNEYKVVMAPFWGLPVLGSCKTKVWTPLRFRCSAYLVSSGPLVNNYLHWHVTVDKHEYSNYPGELDKIMCFKPARNRFSYVPLPCTIHAEGDVILGLGVLDGCLCMSRKEMFGAQILQMKEYGVAESWSILFNFHHDIDREQVVPLFYTDEKKGEVLMKFGDNVISYGINVRCHRYIASLTNFTDDVIVYQETLVRPVGYNKGYKFLRRKASSGGTYVSDSEEKEEESSEEEWDDECYGYWSSIQDTIESRMEKKALRLSLY